MTKPLRFSAMVMNCGSQVHHGQWRHPDNRHADFNDVNMWIDLAKRLETGLFDLMFFVDVVGLYGAADGPYEIFAREGLQFPNNDPAVLLGALAVATENIGLAYTSSTIQNFPFQFARQISTLDHMSNGRVAWNIVTGINEQGVRNFGYDEMEPRAERYARAEEFVDVCYKLWEGSWDEGALLKDRARGIFADADKIHKIYHKGERFRVDGPHLSSPGPQRTPFLLQAGASGPGKAFAARHAEGIFIVPPTIESAAEGIKETKDLAVAAGRSADDITFFYGTSFVIGSTMEEALPMTKDLDDYASIDGYFAHMASATGITAGSYAPDTPLSQIETNQSEGLLAWLKQSIHGREATVADAAALASHQRTVGTPESIADKLEELQRVGVNGVMVTEWRVPETFDEFTEHLLPELQKRGLAKTAYAPGTLRHKMTGHDYLPDTHPAAAYRGAFSKK